MPQSINGTNRPWPMNRLPHWSRESRVCVCRLLPPGPRPAGLTPRPSYYRAGAGDRGRPRNVARTGPSRVPAAGPPTEGRTELGRVRQGRWPRPGNPTTKKPLADPWRLKLLEADYVVGTRRGAGRERPGGPRRRLVSLRAAEKEYPEAAALLQALVSAYERLEQPADADRVLSNLEKMKDQAELRLPAEGQAPCRPQTVRARRERR